jgi:hypothetical protein
LRALLVSAVLVAAGCRVPTVALDLRVEGDAGACEQYADVACVNFLDFVVARSGGEVVTHCVTVPHRMTNLCDLQSLATGGELFRLDQDDVVDITVRGMRVFPATSCEPLDPGVCPEFNVFRGTADKVTLAASAGGRVSLAVHLVNPCGETTSEKWWPRSDGLSCDVTCRTNGFSKVVCDGILEGCLCTAPLDAGVPGVPRDAGFPTPGGAWSTGAPDAGAGDVLPATHSP